MNSKQSWLITGLIFAILWPSASTATKLALTEAQPLVVAVCRFGIAAAIMLFISHVILRKRLPQRSEWKQLAIYGLLNISVYLGMYVIAMKEVTASVGALTVAASPVFISFLSFFLLKKPISFPILLALLVCISGFVVVAWPLIGEAAVTVRGLTLLILSMFSYSVGTIYFSSKKWEGLHLLTINGWQTLLGGLFLLPFMFITYKKEANHFDHDFWIGTTWLAIPVSIVAVLLWLKLIKQDAVKAGLWLFLCPIFGILIAAILLKDKVSAYTVVGVTLVLTGLGISHYGKRKFRMPFSRYIFRD
ncbi:DMT family transporter [Niabella ginsengisoli]|uniref:EamA family transporter n=1 Tax=Niabella ginsengisoli TaxID=522298 RepID=A0ABS9SP17_9BACT|nr:EamA family transporter [Niabella ginsengisoli]MCH5600134.1 EamA family transporter [Niabella ginsengisoli]